MSSATALTLGIIGAVGLLAVVFGFLVRSLIRGTGGSTSVVSGVDK
jgi:hypothetical protein